MLFDTTETVEAEAVHQRRRRERIDQQRAEHHGARHGKEQPFEREVLRHEEDQSQREAAVQAAPHQHGLQDLPMRGKPGHRLSGKMVTTTDNARAT